MTDTTTHIAALEKRCRELEEAVRVLAVELVSTGPENVADFLQMGSNPIARAAVEKASG